jgi:hypothetical protein
MPHLSSSFLLGTEKASKTRSTAVPRVLESFKRRFFGCASHSLAPEHQCISEWF